MDQFRQWHQERHQYARDWKQRTGGKVLGYFCTYVPEEIVYAAGVLPVRIFGSHETQDVAEAHIFSMFCPFCRDCLAQGLKGRYDYLDGIAIAQSCLHIRNTFSSWKLHVPTEYSYFLLMPHHVQSPRARPFLAGELAKFRRSIEEWTGVTIGDGDLDRAIEVYNTNRRLMREVYGLRRAASPPLSGAEAMEMVISSQLVDKEEHNRALESFLDEARERDPDQGERVRLMLVGSEDDDTGFIAMVESLGASVVADDHCTGSRYFWNDVFPQEDRLAALAARYVDRVPCPSKDWPEWKRFEHILNLARDYNVRAAILTQQKFCDPHECDIPPLQKLLQENGIPSLFLEFDMTLPLGPFRTRVEAFLEMLEAEDLF